MDQDRTDVKPAGLLESVLMWWVYFFVFGTGAAGLIYEVTWQRYFAGLFGSDTISTAVVMGVFLGGLSLGYFLCGKLSTKVKDHLKVYAVLEAIIAIWGFLFPSLFAAFKAATVSLSFEPPFFLIFEGVISTFLLIGVPTVCMGATVPMLTRGISASLEASTGTHARVYGINTAGAFAGTLAAGFFLIPTFGLPLSVLGTATINICAAAFFYVVSKKGWLRSSSDPSPQKTDDENQPGSSRNSARKIEHLPLYAIAFVSGLYVMTLENVLMRITNLTFGSSSYSFSLVLAVFLLAIAIGSLVVGKMRNITRKTLFANQLVLTFFFMALYLVLDQWPYYAHLLRIGFQMNTSGFYLYYATAFVVLLVFLLGPLSFAGATIPIVFHEVKQNLSQVGRHSGLLLSWNTVGSLLGSIVGGIVLYYFLDCPQIYLVAVTLAAISTGIVSFSLGRIPKIIAAITLVTALAMLITTPFYNKSNLLYGVFRHRTPLASSFSGPQAFFDEILSFGKFLYTDDGPTMSVSVSEHEVGTPEKPQKSRSILVNGKSDSNTIGDLYTTRLSAHLPTLFASDPKRALVIGFGTGITVGEIGLYDQFEQIDVAEISPRVVEALRFFDESNHEVRKDPRLRIHMGDAFRVIGRSDHKWDVIVSEPSNPWVTGVDLLYTEDFYEIVKAKLNNGGTFLQWVHIYAANDEMIGMAINTIRTAFKQVHVFVGSSSDLLFLAKMDGISSADIERAEKRFDQSPKAKSSLIDLEIPTLDGLLLRQLWSPTFLADRFGNHGIQSLDNPRLHYIAGKAFFESNALQIDNLFNHETAFYWEEYLLARRYPDWSANSFAPQKIAALISSGRLSPLSEGLLPSNQMSLLKAHLSNKITYPLSEEDRKRYRPDLIELIATKESHETLWPSTEFATAPLYDRCKALIEHVEATRRWVVPYPLYGLLSLLSLGASTQTDPFLRNWYLIQSAIFAADGQPTQKSVLNLKASLSKNGDGAVALNTETSRLLRKFMSLASPE